MQNETILGKRFISPKNRRFLENFERKIKLIFSPLKTRFRVQEQDTETRTLFLYVFWDAD